jgi:hypothetical protein
MHGHIFKLGLASLHVVEDSDEDLFIQKQVFIERNVKHYVVAFVFSKSLKHHDKVDRAILSVPADELHNRLNRQPQLSHIAIELFRKLLFDVKLKLSVCGQALY